MNLMAFPFFDSFQEMRAQTRHGEYLLTSTTRFLPFQIRKPHDGQPIDCINVFFAETDTLYKTIMGNQITYDYHQTPLFDFITYYGATLAEPIPCGLYYLEIQGRYSAVFGVLNSVADLLRVEWANNTNLIDNAGVPLVLYQTGFLQRLHLRAEVLSPVYPYAEDGKENEYKEFFPEFKRVAKQSQFNTLLVPEYLVDALGSLPLHSTVHIGAQHEAREIEINPDWQELGTVASVNVKFSEATPVIAMGCGKEQELEAIDTTAYAPRGFVCGVEDTSAAWTDTGNVSCELDGGGNNTGYKLTEQQDMNPNSATYLEYRTVRSLDTTLCAVAVTYYSREQSEYVQRNDCGAGYTGSTVLVKVPAGAYSSTVSQLDADNQALAQLNAIKQEEANTRGTCTRVLEVVYTGKISRDWATPSQACADEPAYNAYTYSGAFEIGQVVYRDTKGTKVVPDSYYSTDGFSSIQVDGGSKIIALKPCVLR